MKKKKETSKKDGIQSKLRSISQRELLTKPAIILRHEYSVDRLGIMDKNNEHEKALAGSGKDSSAYIIRLTSNDNGPFFVENSRRVRHENGQVVYNQYSKPVGIIDKKINEREQWEEEDTQSIQCPDCGAMGDNMTLQRHSKDWYDICDRVRKARKHYDIPRDQPIDRATFRTDSHGDKYKEMITDKFDESMCAHDTVKHRYSVPKPVLDDIKEYFLPGASQSSAKTDHRTIKRKAVVDNHLIGQDSETGEYSVYKLNNVGIIKNKRSFRRRPAESRDDYVKPFRLSKPGIYCGSTDILYNRDGKPVGELVDSIPDKVKKKLDGKKAALAL